MSESFSVQSRLQVSSNAPAVLRELIEGFERFDQVLKGSQENLNRFAVALKELGAGQSGINKIVAGLDKLSSIKLGGSLLNDLKRAADLTSGVSTSSAEMRNNVAATARAWQEIAAASGKVKSPAAPGAQPFVAPESGKPGGKPSPAESILLPASEKEKNAFAKYDRERMSHHEFGLAGMGAQMAGQAGMDFFEKSIMRNFDVQHELAVITADRRVSQKQLDNIRQQAEDLTRTIPGSTIAGNLEVFTDLKNTFGSLQEAQENLKPFVQMVTALQMIDKRQGGVGKLGSALDLARFIEDQGGAINPKTGHYDPEKFVEIANRTLQVAIATNMRVNPREFLTFQKQARSGGMMLDDHALYGELPYFLKAYGSAKLGTALFSNFQVMLAGRLQRRREEYLEDIGIIPKGTGHMVGKGPGAHFEYDPAKIRGRELMMSDPFAWIHDILAPAIAQKYHLDINTSEGQKGVILHMTEAAQRNTIAGMWAEVFRNYTQAQKEARNIEATTPNALAHFAKNDPMAQIMIFRAAEDQFLVEMGKLASGPAIEGLKGLTSLLHEFNDLAKDHPTIAKYVVELGALGSVFMNVAGSLVMVGFFAKPVLRLFGSLASAIIPFGEGGAAAAGMAGLTAALTGLAGLLASLGFLAWSVHPKSTVDQKTEDALIGKQGANPHRFEHVGAPKSTDHSMTEMHRYLDKITGGAHWADSLGRYVDRLADPKSYYHEQAEHIAGPNKQSLLYTGDKPLKVEVVNGKIALTNGRDLLRGTASGVADLLNRPDAGTWGPDPSSSPVGAQYGR